MIWLIDNLGFQMHWVNFIRIFPQDFLQAQYLIWCLSNFLRIPYRRPLFPWFEQFITGVTLIYSIRNDCWICGSHSGGYEELCLLVSSTVWSVESQQMFRSNMLPSLSGSKNKLSLWFLAWLVLQPWRWRWHGPPKRRLNFSALNGVIIQKLELFND
jgi:hypothetical protein